MDISGEFAIWIAAGPDYYQGVVLGYADGRRLYEFSVETSLRDGLLEIFMGSGRRNHPFEDRLVGRMRTLLEAAVFAVVDLPFISVNTPDSLRRVLFGPENLIELTLYQSREPQIGRLVEFARVEA